MENTIKDPSQIKGWGIDADPRNDPTYPMKKHDTREHEGYYWERPLQQPLNTEILHSNERPNVSATFGTSSPPTGLSGMIRRYAFRYSESSYGHWVPLIVADRVGAAEGILADLAHGRIPNLFEEMGGKVQWKYNRKALVTQVLVGAVVVSAAVALLRSRRKN